MERNAKGRPLDLSKIAHNLSNHHEHVDPGRQPFVVLVLSGAISPIHKMHLQCFEITRRYLQSTMNRTVLGAFVCPSSDSYVTSKLGDQAISLTNRNYLSELATRDSDWISVNTWGYAGAGSIVRETKTILNNHFPGYQFDVWLVVGADHAHRHTLFLDGKLNVACIGRPGETKVLKAAMKKCQKVSSNFVTIEEVEEDVSSTKVRKMILEGKWDELATVVPVPVVQHLKTVGRQIFIGPAFENGRNYL